MNSKTYWSQREAEQLKKNTRDEVKYNKRINDILDYTMDNVQKEINGFYARYATKEGITLAEARKRVSQLDIEAYERKAKKYVKDKDFSDQANEEMRIYNATMKINRLEMLKANIGLELVDGFDELQKYFDVTLSDRTLAEFKRQAGILGHTVQNNQRAAHAIVNASFHNAKFSERIWLHQDMLKAELDRQLQIGLIQGRGSKELARHIAKAFGASKADAERLMQTELARVQTEAQKQSYEQSGYDQYTFIAEPTACPICKKIDGKKFDVVKMMPGTNAPPIHPWCRCSTAAAFMDEDEFDKWLDEVSEQNRKAEEIRKQAEQMEPNVTKMLRGIEKSTGAKLRGLEHRLKGTDRILEKIAEEPNKKVRDALRYTFELNVDNYVDEYHKIIAKLEEKGYTQSEVKNFWANDMDPYNGLNTNIFTDGKYEFEVQYHTQESLAVKDKMRALYEKARKLDRRSTEYLKILDEMYDISESVKIPKGVKSI